MATQDKTYDLSEVKSGYFMCWEVCTQAGYASTVKLVDESGKEYFKYSKPRSSGNFQMLGQGSADCRGNKLRLVVSTEVDGGIKQSINSYNITDSNAKTIGHGYNLCIEDSTDEDYNDIYVNLVGWAKKG
ncbi:MAG: hypothetical protein LBL94_05550 [Prevotellaceae bacterium]|jgi:hypothetical protein|nr:hypothetical protein [Prevotellaceae bacterium]